MILKSNQTSRINASEIFTMPNCTIIPVLEYLNVEEAIKYLSDTFGFKLRWRAGNHRAQLVYDEGVIVVTELKEKNSDKSILQASNKHSILVKVKDIDSHFENATKSGAKILQEPTDHFFGERQYSAIDAEEHIWTFSETKKELRPEEWGATTNR